MSDDVCEFVCVSAYMIGCVGAYDRVCQSAYDRVCVFVCVFVIPLSSASVTVRAALLAPMIFCVEPNGLNSIKPPLANAPFFPFFLALVVVVVVVMSVVAVLVSVWLVLSVPTVADRSESNPAAVVVTAAAVVAIAVVTAGAVTDNDAGGDAVDEAMVGLSVVVLLMAASWAVRAWLGEQEGGGRARGC